MAKRSSQVLVGALVVSQLGACSITSKLIGGSRPGSSSTPVASSVPADRASVADATPAAASTQPGSTAPAADAEPAKPKENTQGIPPKLVELVHAAYGVDPDRPGNEIGPRNNYFDVFRAPAKAFEEAWIVFEKRKTEVTAAVTNADGLEKAGKLAEARAALEAVITPVTTDAEGKIDARARKTLDPRDAELPAIAAWIRVVAAMGDKQALVEAGRNLYIRRKPRDRDTELWFWLSAADDKAMSFLVSQNTPGIQQDVYKVYTEAANVRGAYPFDTEGQRLAGNHFAGLSQYGLSWTTVDVEKGKKGDWVMIRVEPVTLGDRDVTHSSTQQWRVPKSCRETSKVSYWDGNGNPVYETACQYDYFERPITLKASLKGAPPAWAKGREMLLVVGKITGAGPAWKLTDAFIPDLRFSETGFLF